MSGNARDARIIARVVVMGLLLVSATALLAQDADAQPAEQPAEQPSPAPLKIGMVDLDIVSEQYQELLEKQNELADWVQTQANYLDELKSYVFLSEQNFAEIAQVLEAPKDTWTEAQKTREEELRKVSEQKEKRFLDLQAKPDRTPEEDDEFNTLAENFSSRREDLTKRAAALEQEYLNMRSEAKLALLSSVRDIIIRLAEQQQYDLVVDSAMVFYSNDRITDLTPVIIQELNKPAGD